MLPRENQQVTYGFFFCLMTGEGPDPALLAGAAVSIFWGHAFPFCLLWDVLCLGPTFASGVIVDTIPEMSCVERQRRHYDDLASHRRPTRFAVSCGYDDRFDPGLLQRRPALGQALQGVFDRILPPDVGTLLDLGCGTAYYWPLLAPRCRCLLGADLSPPMVAAGQRHWRQQGWGRAGGGIVGEATAIPCRDGVVDVVLAIDVFHHFPDLSEVVDEVHRVLRPGGLVVAVEPNILNPMVFLAHLLPPEERRALWPNHAWALAGALGERFAEVESVPLTYVSGLDSPWVLHWLDQLAPVFECSLMAPVALRRAYRARRRP